MQPPIPPPPPLLSLDAKVALLGLGSAALTTLGIFFQKLNGVRFGNPLFSVWLLLAIISFFPTFVIANKVFLMGGRMSLFVPATALTYVLSMIVGRLCFGESIPPGRWLGCALIVAGIVAVVRS